MAQCNARWSEHEAQRMRLCEAATAAAMLVLFAALPGCPEGLALGARGFRQDLLG